MVESVINQMHMDEVRGVDHRDVVELRRRRAVLAQRVEWGWDEGYFNFILDSWRHGIATLELFSCNLVVVRDTVLFGTPANCC